MLQKQLLLALTAFLFSFYTSAQDNESGGGLAGAVAVKWAPASIYFGKLSFSGEYSLNDKQSLTLGVGIPFNKTVRQEIDDEEESLTHKTFSLMAGYRFYLGKRPGNGLYLEPFIKYLTHDAHSILEGDVGGSTRQFHFTSDYSAVGVGGQLGVQFTIGNNFMIDLYFLGPEANIAKHETLSREIGAGPPWDAQDAQDAEEEIKDFFSDIPLLKDKLEVTVNANSRSANTKYSGFLPGIRAGVSIGFRF